MRFIGIPLESVQRGDKPAGEDEKPPRKHNENNVEDNVHSHSLPGRLPYQKYV
jgi:hypothetical protein